MRLEEAGLGDNFDFGISGRLGGVGGGGIQQLIVVQAKLRSQISEARVDCQVVSETLCFASFRASPKGFHLRSIELRRK